VKSHSKF